MEPRALHGTRLEGPAGGGRSESLAPAAWPNVPALVALPSPAPPALGGWPSGPPLEPDRLWSLTAAPARRRRRFEPPKQAQTTKKVN